MSGVVRHLAVALAAGLLLTGCGQMADQAAESMIEGATGADVDMSDGGMTIRDGDSEVTIDTDGELPATYPSDLPTPSGGVLTTVTETPEGLMAVWEFDRLTEADFDQFTAEIQRAGYAAEGDTLALDSGSDISRIASFSADGKTVMVTAMGSDESGQITVLVTQNLE